MSTAILDTGLLPPAGHAQQMQVEGAVGAGVRLFLGRTAERDPEPALGSLPAVHRPAAGIRLLADAVLAARQAVAAFAHGAAPTAWPQEDPRLAAIGQMIEDAWQLQREAEADEEEPAIPPSILSLAIELAARSQPLVQNWFRPRLATDGCGGVRMTWARDGREIRAVVPASRARYLYVEQGAAQEHIPNFDEMTLASEIAKAFGGARSAR